LPIFATQTATNYAEFISLPDLSGTGPLLTLADPDFAIARMSAFLRMPDNRSASSAKYAPNCELNEWQKLGSG